MLQVLVARNFHIHYESEYPFQMHNELVLKAQTMKTQFQIDLQHHFHYQIKLDSQIHFVISTLSISRVIEGR